MALGKIGKAIGKTDAKAKKKSDRSSALPEGDARERAVEAGEKIVSLDSTIRDLESQEEALYAKLMATKIGQELQEVRDGLGEAKKRLKGLESSVIPLIQVVEPETLCLSLNDGCTLTVDEKIGNKSSANTKGALEEFFGKDQTEKYWEQLEGKKTTFLALDRPEDD